MKIDLHVHTRYSSDSLIDPKELPKIAKRKGLDGVAITDHDSVAAFKFIPRESDMFTIPGIEVKTSIGEIIGLFVSERVEANEPSEVMDQIKERGGLVILPHPHSFPRRHPTKLTKISSLLDKVDAIEAFNSRMVLRRYNTKSLQLAQRLKKPVTAGSDAHFGFEVGNAYTIFMDVHSAEDVYHKIKNGKNKISGKQTCSIVHLLTTMTRIGKIMAQQIEGVL